MHNNASLILTVWFPSDNPLKAPEDTKGPPSNEYWYGDIPVPGLAATVTDPSEPPLQVISDNEVTDPCRLNIVTVKATVVVHRRLFPADTDTIPYGPSFHLIVA